MTTLHDFQFKLLSDAAQRKDGFAALPPDELTAATRRRIGKLVSAGLIEEVPAKRGASVWRETDGERFALRITAAGLAAIGADQEEAPPAAPSVPSDAELAARGFVRVPARPGRGHIIAAPVGPWTGAPAPGGDSASGASGGVARGPASRRRAASAPGSKQARIIVLLRRGGGVTLGDLIAATGWQAHSVRGFLSGTVKKKLGLPVLSEKGVDGVRRYHIGVLSPGHAEAR